MSGPINRSAKASKLVERRAGARGHDIGRMRPAAISIRGMRMTVTRPRSYARRLAQEGAFARIALDQLDPGHAEDRQHQPGKPGAAAEIDQAARACAGHSGSSCAEFEEMPAPQIGERIAADQVDPRRPPRQQLGIGFQPGQCFT